MHSAQFARVSLSPAGDWFWMTRVSVSSQSVTKSTLPKWLDFASLERESKFRAPKRREIKRHSQNRENYLILFGEPSSGYLLFFFFLINEAFIFLWFFRCMATGQNLSNILFQTPIYKHLARLYWSQASNAMATYSKPRYFIRFKSSQLTLLVRLLTNRVLWLLLKVIVLVMH